MMKAAPSCPSFATFAHTPEGSVLSVLSKRSYRWTARGELALLDEQPPLAHDIKLAEREDRNGEVMLQGRDTWPLKLATDVVVSGHARSAHDRRVSQLNVELSVGPHLRRITALGPRYVEYHGNGELSFTPAEPFTSVEMSWWNAYGGIDPTLLPKGLDDTPLFMGKPVLELFPGAYPRNPSGTGYLVAETPMFLDGLALPQLEDPAALLQPATFLVRDPAQWWRRPTPACFGWYNALWYPRILHAGGKPYYLPESSEPSAPASTPDEEWRPQPGQPYFRPELMNEAAPGLILPFLNGDETIALAGFGTEDKQHFQLPRERPRVQARADGLELEELACRIHTLAIDADKREFYLLFSNRFFIPSALADDMSDGLTRTGVVSRCTVLVDDVPLAPEDWPPVGEEGN